MNQQEVIDRIQALIGGIATDESIPNQGYILSKLNSLREYAIGELYKRFGIDDFANYMNFYAEYDEDLQDGAGCGYVNFSVPAPIRLSEDRSGFGSGVTIGEKNMDIIILGNEAAFKTYMMHPVTSAMNRLIAFYDYGNRLLKVKGDVRSFTLLMIAKNPNDIPTWNPEKDEYPMSGSCLEIIEDSYRNGTLPWIWRTNPNKISNSTEDSKQQEQVKS